MSEDTHVSYEVLVGGGKVKIFQGIFCKKIENISSFGPNRDSQFIWSGRDWVPSPPANDPWKRMMVTMTIGMVMATKMMMKMVMATKKTGLGRL